MKPSKQPQSDLIQPKRPSDNSQNLHPGQSSLNQVSLIKGLSGSESKNVSSTKIQEQNFVEANTLRKQDMIVSKKNKQQQMNKEVTIPINFEDEVLAGMDNSDDDMIKQVKDEKWILELNSSVIQRIENEKYVSNINNKEEDEQIYSPNLSNGSRGKNVIQHLDQNKLASPLAQYNYEFEELMNPQHENNFKGKTKRQLKQAKLEKQPQNYTKTTRNALAQNLNVSKFDHDDPQENAGLNIIGNNYSTGKGTAQKQRVERSHDEILQTYDKNNQNLQSTSNNLLSPEYIHTLKLKSHKLNLANINNDSKNDISELQEKFAIDYNQKVSLDDRRARMFVIGNIMAAKYQGEVKDDQFFMIVDKTPLEKIDDFTGRCIKLRKIIWTIKTQVNNLCFFIISNKIFDGISLFFIVLNSIQLAGQDPTATDTAPLFEVMDNIFLAFYSSEMCIKIIGLGFILNKGAYLRDPWNILDFTIVSSGLLQLALQGGSVNLSAMRSFRVLRPLKTISGIEGLRIIVSALLKSSKLLMESFIVLYFAYLLFSIAGLQLFMGVLKKQCISIETGQPAIPTSMFNQCGGYTFCPDGYLCGKTNKDPFYDQVNFNTIFYSFISVFLSVSLEGWTYEMKFTQKAYTLYAWAFYCPLTFIVSFFLIQLTQAVITSKFAEEHNKSHEQGTSKKKKKKKQIVEFESLEEEDQEKALSAQEEARLVVLKKWKQIMFLKQQMRIMIKQYKERKKQEEQEKQIEKQKSVQYGLAGIPGFTFQEQLDYESILGYDRQQDQSSNNMISQRTNMNDALSLKLYQSPNKQNNISIIMDQKAITEEDEFVQEMQVNQVQKNKEIKKNRENLLGIQTLFKNKVANDPEALKQLNLMNKVIYRNGVPYDDSARDQLESERDQNNQISFRSKLAINEQFFDEFIKAELTEIEQAFTVDQLKELIVNIEGGNDFLKTIDENLEDELEVRSYSHVSYTSDENGKLTNRYHHKTNRYNVSESSDEIENKNPLTSTTFSQKKNIFKKQATQIQQYKHEQISIDGDKLNETTIQVARHYKRNINEQIYKSQDINRIQETENINNQTFNTSQIALIQNKDVAVGIGGRVNKPVSLTTATNYQGTNVNDTNITEKIKKNISKDNRIEKKFTGTNSITNQDFIPIEKSYLNNKYLVNEDIGKHKKIYVRKDKFDFERPQTDIFELREKQKREQLEEKLKYESTDYLSNIKIQPYQRKCYLDPYQIILSEDNKEMLKAQTLDVSDIEECLQKQYNKAFLSQLFVTGTLSIVINVKSTEECAEKVRKLQNKRQQNETKDNMFLMYIVKQYLPNSFMSRSIPKDKQSSSKQDAKQLSSNIVQVSQSESVSNNLNKSILLSRRMSHAQGALLGQKRFSTKAGISPDYGDINNEKMRKEMILMKKANKDQNFQKRITMVKLQKDAMRSLLFRIIYIKRRNELIARGEKDKLYQEDELKDSDEEDQDNLDDDDEDAKIDDYFLDFDCTTEIFRAKKQALQKKISRVQWSGQDVLLEYDPKEAKYTSLFIDDIRVWPKGLYKYYKFLQVHTKNFVMGSFMDNLMILCVGFNTCCLAIDRYGIDEEQASILNQANTLFTYIFISEMSLKIIGLGLIKYLKDKMNYVDGTVVLLSVVELFLSAGGGAFSAFRSVRIFRTFRVLRITRLLRAMKDMTSIINALMKSMTSLMYLYLLMFLFIFIFALLGMQIYGGKLDFEENSDGYPGVPRQNYDSFYWAFQVSFQLLTQENWQIILFDTLRTPQVSRVLTMIYHIAWMTLGNTTLLNLLMAIMLDSFNSHDEEEEQNEDKARKKHLNFMKSQEGEELILYFQEQKGSAYQVSQAKRRKKDKKKDENLLDESFDLEGDFNIASIKKKKQEYEGNFCELSWYLFTKKNPLRRFLYWLSNHQAFENMIQTIILVSSVKLVADSYTKILPQDSLFMLISANLDYFFTIAFALESFIKALSLGFIMDKGTYLRESWSQLDFFIVITSLIDISFSNINMPFIKVLRLLRTLRPLRVISHNSEMKTIINGLIYSVTGIFYVAILLLVVWIMFAIIAVNLMGGKFNQCSVDPYINSNPEDCLKAQGEWFNWYFNYDNVVIALISLFDVATLENWPDQRDSANDISGENEGPIRNNSLFYAYFFNAFIMIGTYCFLNLLIGVIFIKFEEAQKEEKESTLLDDQQFRWLDMLKMIVKATPDLETTNVPKNLFRKKIHEIVTGKNEFQKPGEEIPINKFDIIVMVVIVLNMFQMCMVYDSATVFYNQQLDYANYAFTGVFIVEAIFKLTAFGFTYFKNSWNQFDFIIVCTSIFDISMGFMNKSAMKVLKVGPSLARILRVLRVSRLFRLIKKYKSLNALLQTIVLSLPALMNVFALFMLVYFIFAILATFLFAEVTTGIVIDDLTNFSNFGRAMLTLIRASTGEDWNYIMYDCTHSENCISGKTCGSVVAWPFFVIFMSIQSFIMMNLFILVIIQQFDKYYLSKGNILEQFKDDLAKFKDIWTYFTREHHCQRMKDTKVTEFFQSMEKPLGMKGDTEDVIMRNLIKMDIQADEEGFYYFNDLLFKTMKQVYCNKPIKNKLLAVNEYIAFHKIIQIRENIIKKQRETLRKKAMSSNPFLMKMYRNISFKLWIKIFQQNIERRKYDLDYGQGEISDPEIEEAAAHNENEEFYYETEVDQTVSSDESSEESDEFNDNQECEESDSQGQGKVYKIQQKNEGEKMIQSQQILQNAMGKGKQKEIEKKQENDDENVKRRNSVNPLIRRNQTVKNLKNFDDSQKIELIELQDSFLIEESQKSNPQLKRRKSIQVQSLTKLNIK